MSMKVLSHKTLLISLSFILLLFLSAPAHSQEKSQVQNFFSHAQVAKKVIKKFESMKTYTADFFIKTVDGRRTKNMRGKFFYKKPNKVSFNFASGNRIVSDGKFLWVYIHRLKAVGKQDLTLKKKNESNRQIFAGTPGPGLTRLFRKYHYHFDSTEQPRMEEGAKVFVFSMKQAEKIGGYEKILLYVDASTFLIRKAIGTDGDGKVTTIKFSNPGLDVTLDGPVFQYKKPKHVKLINNPLVNEVKPPDAN